MDASEYKHVCLGLIFLKYISDAFEEKREQLLFGYADPKSEWFIKDEPERAKAADERDNYTAANVFWLPPEARWHTIKARAKSPEIGKVIDDAMGAIERKNPTLKGVLPRDYARPSLDKVRLGGLVDIISNIGFNESAAKSKDALGRVYEYFLAPWERVPVPAFGDSVQGSPTGRGKFASAEGKGGGEFYTPQCVVQVLVAMLEPYKGRVFDPCCGSGGIFVSSEKFVEEHGGRVGDIAVYGQEAVSDLSKAFALAVPHYSALEIRDEVGFFQEVRAVFAKSISEGGGKSPEELELAVRQIVSRAISSDKVIDIFDAAGLKKPDISILSDEFLSEVQHLPQRNLAVELLQKLLNNELKIRSKKYLVQSRSFAEMLEATIRKYQNRTIEATQVIAELIELDKQMREGQKRGKDLGLTDDEVAFYDALETNDSAVKVLGEPTLKNIARELVSHVRKSVTIDWTLRESAQAQIRVLVHRILRKYGYPPDKQEKATQTVLEQAKLLCAEWAA